jgi:hypothetical protein
MNDLYDWIPARLASGFVAFHTTILPGLVM